MRIAVRIATRGGLAAMLVLALHGCVGVVRTRLDWVQLPMDDMRTKAQVRARFGDPVRTEGEAAGEVWYYALSGATLGDARPATEAATILYLLITPVWWRTHPGANARFRFDGDAVAEAATLTATERGFFCGLNIAATHLALCGPVP
jgi:hypothetical protein